MARVVSGIRPTGKLHLGNYFGAVKSFLKMQEEHECFFFIADIHSLTTHPTPSDLHQNVLQVMAEHLAMGIDIEKCSLFIQSDVPAISELYTYLNMNAYIGELERSVTYKEKKATQPKNINAGLLTYPVLMAVDILAHHADLVPVGKDQQQHLEMTRTFANRFNHMYGTDYFKEPQAYSNTGELVKVPGLTGQGKMSKSSGDADTIVFDEDEAAIRKKIMRAKTDTGPTEPNMEKSEELQNLFDIMALVSDYSTIAHFDDLHQKATIRYGDLKKQLADDVVSFVAPIRERITHYKNDAAALAHAAKIGAEKANESAYKTMKEVKEIMGFRKFY
ncbi:tryptophan--tRNA ligase [Bacteroidia bacterium]|nr:tryptophan--tRNA ligase [Bacteroidia bacterium]MDB9883407.1 tryptophan--tRNA ligase [Bacteroidia bacterium]